ncbi:ABC transporter substrate-binding protein [Paenibacillus sp. P96]|uniref:ABC transporter substrate-binding protein n=1 Tax=Paenibacillus zeirhizosphaerae TaxID=2987519 RepID=A0ABT9FWB2_9BACL|nr:ABC transporter substrate-binding protein [Paenibacillus sp. P96]MDP4098787.1 ABC transporter substrate-binding protein [Paenibacillus sp. P96]
MTKVHYWKWILITCLVLLLTACTNTGTSGVNVSSDNTSPVKEKELEPAIPGQASGSTQQAEGTPISEPTAEPYLTFQDLNGDTVTLENKPERIIILNNELTELFYQAGGQAAGIATSAGVEIPEQAANVKQVGVISSVNMEEILQLKPDLVIGQPLFHKDLKSTFADSGIPFAILTVKSIEDIRNNAKLFGQIIGNEEQVQTAIGNMDAKLNELTADLPANKPSYAIITLMANSVSLQKSSSIALDISSLLQMNNIAEDLLSGKTPSSVPFSMEKLVELNPEHIFIVVHGSDEEGQRMIQSQLESNPSWKSLQAVKSGHLEILPPSMFVTSPGLKIWESVEYMKQLVFPFSAATQ